MPPLGKLLLVLVALAAGEHSAEAQGAGSGVAEVQPPARAAAQGPAERRGREYLELMNRGRLPEVRAFVQRSLAPRMVEAVQAERWPLVVGLDGVVRPIAPGLASPLLAS